MLGKIVIRSVLVYHYYELDELHRENLQFFLKNGYSLNIDYIFLIAGECSVELPQKSNIKYINIPNLGNDFSGYVYAVNNALNLNSYDYYFFMNSSVCGPFLPSFYDKNWTKFFIKLFDNEVHLVGTTINILDPLTGFSMFFEKYYGLNPPFPHIQTMFFALDKIGINFLKNLNFFNRETNISKGEIIVHYEILMSQLFLRHGYNINCILHEYQNIDYRKITKDINRSSHFGDVCYADAFFGRTLEAHEVIFIKTNRNMLTAEKLNSLKITKS